MRRKRFEAVGVLVFAVVATLAAACPREAVADDAPSADERQQKLIEVLLSDAPKATKAITCKQLTLCGDKEAVPVLAPLLADEELASWALIPLEAIPGPEADAALREAAGKLKGRLLIGVINSIAMRGDAEAVELLIGHLKDADAGVASAAAAALGKIGGGPATAALTKSLKGAPDAVRSAVAEGIIFCAEKYLAANDAEEAARLYDMVRNADVHQQRIVEATRGAILARGASGLPILVDELQSEDREMFYVALRAARELGGPDVTKALIKELARLQKADESDSSEPAPKELVIKSARYGAGNQWADVTETVSAMINANSLLVQASNSLAGDPAQGVMKELQVTYTLGGEEKSVVVAEEGTLQIGEGVPDSNPREAPLIYALCDVGDPLALPVVLDTAKSGSQGARLAAVRVLAKIGDAAAVPILLKAAQASGELGTAALDSLDKLEGDAVDRAVAAELGDATGRNLIVLVQLVGTRGIESAVPQLLTAADSDDTQIRTAAISALGMTVGFDKLGALIDRFVEPKYDGETDAIKKALLAACTRMADRNATAEKLSAAMSGTSPENQVTLMELVTAVGGEKALSILAAAARSNDDTKRDLGSRLLGEWMGPDAAPVLLDLAKTSTENKYKVRALRGYLRIARQFEVPLDDRINMCHEALKVAQRADERKLALEVLRRHPTLKGLTLATLGLRDTELRADAALSAVEIAEKILAAEPAAVAAAMKQVVAAGGDRKVTDRAKALLEKATKAAGQ
jgi:HEAT repeat protein